MAALVAAYVTLVAVLPFLALWHGNRTGNRPTWRTGPIPATIGVATHRAPPPDTHPEWNLQRMAAGGW